MKFLVFFKPVMSSKYKAVLKKAKSFHKLTKKTGNHDMYCPYCGSLLIATDRVEPLETLNEHVSCCEPTLKTVYKCIKSKDACQYAKWAYDGGMYVDFPEDSSKEETDNIWKIIHDSEYFKGGWTPEAINSISYISEINVINPGKKQEYKLRFYKNQKYVPVIIMNYIYDSFGTCKYVSPELVYRTYSSPYTYQQTLCITTQIFNLIKKIKRNLQNVKKYPNVKRNQYELYGYSNWGGEYEIQKTYIVHYLFYKYCGKFIFHNILKYDLPELNNNN